MGIPAQRILVILMKSVRTGGSKFSFRVMGMLKKSSPLVRWLLAANLVLLAIIAFKYVRPREDPYAETKSVLQTAGGATKEEAEVIMGHDRSAIIDLFDRIVSEMPADSDEKWRGRLTIVAARLGVEKEIPAAEKARISGIAKRLIVNGRSRNNAEAQIDGALCVARYGAIADVGVLEPLLSSQDPRVRASAEKAVKRLTDAKA